MEYICMTAERPSKQAEIGNARTETEYKDQKLEGASDLHPGHKWYVYIWCKFMDTFFHQKRDKARKMDTRTKFVDLVGELGLLV